MSTEAWNKKNASVARCMARWNDSQSHRILQGGVEQMMEGLRLSVSHYCRGQLCEMPTWY
jgi:hypothetical protein